MTDRTFAERLRAIIDTDETLTEAGLAKSAGLSNATIRKLLAGNTQNPRMDTARKVCAALGTTLEEFMSDDQSPEALMIVRLLAKLPPHLRQQLLGYGQALADAADQSQPAPDAIEKSTKDHSS